MKTAKYIIPILGLIAMFSFQTCKHCTDPTNPDCANYDPCYGQKTINTFFKVRPGDRGFPPPEEWCDLVPTDTFNASSVRFDMPDGNPENSTYEWQIGAEPEPRYGEGFEIDFSEYLNLGNHWESHIPITLTIRTPPNGCLTNPGDTLITVTRELFFTNERQTLYAWNDSLREYDTIARFLGTFKSNPDDEVVLEYRYITEGKFRGVEPPYVLITGFPSIDTLMPPRDCFSGGCSNYKHSKVIIYNPNDCRYKELANYVKSNDQILSEQGKKLKTIYVFEKPSGRETYEFNGVRL